MSEPTKAMAMVPDSTQSGNSEKDIKRTKRKKKKQQQLKKKRKEGSDGNKDPTKKKKNIKTKVQGTNDQSPTGEEKEGDMTSDLDLTKPLFTLGHYINDREEMLKHAFQSVSKEQLLAMIPDVLKDCPTEVLKAMCLGQLEGMSKKRIQHVLAGEEMLSSSDTDESGNELEDQKMESQSPEAGDGNKETEIEQVQDEEGTDLVKENEEAVGAVQDEVQGEEQVEEYQEDLQEEADVDVVVEEEDIYPSVKLEPMSDTSPERYSGSQQSPAMYQEDQELEREYFPSRSPQMETEGEGETALSREDQTADQPLPVKRRKKRKKPVVKRNIDPADLEEGEVEDASSEYTDASEEESETRAEGGQGELETNLCKGEEALERVCVTEGGEVTGTVVAQSGIGKEMDNDGDTEMKEGNVVQQCVEDEEQNLDISEEETLSGVSDRKTGSSISEEKTMKLPVSANGDALSVDNESELEDEQEETGEGGETSHQSGETQEPCNSREDLSDREKNDFDSEENVGEVDESDSSTPQDEQSDRSDLIKSNKSTETGETVENNEGTAGQSELTAPRLDVLELELRARAIRSLMKHCINEKK